jgi:hypothetical protein
MSLRPVRQAGRVRVFNVMFGLEMRGIASTAERRARSWAPT